MQEQGQDFVFFLTLKSKKSVYMYVWGQVRSQMASHFWAVQMWTIWRPRIQNLAPCSESPLRFSQCGPEGLCKNTGKILYFFLLLKSKKVKKVYMYVWGQVRSQMASHFWAVQMWTIWRPRIQNLAPCFESPLRFSQCGPKGLCKNRGKILYFFLL